MATYMTILEDSLEESYRELGNLIASAPYLTTLQLRFAIKGRPEFAYDDDVNRPNPFSGLSTHLESFRLHMLEKCSSRVHRRILQDLIRGIAGHPTLSWISLSHVKLRDLAEAFRGVVPSERLRFPLKELIVDDFKATALSRVLPFTDRHLEHLEILRGPKEDNLGPAVHVRLDQLTLHAADDDIEHLTRFLTLFSYVDRLVVPGRGYGDWLFALISRRPKKPTVLKTPYLRFYRPGLLYLAKCPDLVELDFSKAGGLYFCDNWAAFLTFRKLERAKFTFYLGDRCEPFIERGGRTRTNRLRNQYQRKFFGFFDVTRALLVKLRDAFCEDAPNLHVYRDYEGEALERLLDRDCDKFLEHFPHLESLKLRLSLSTKLGCRADQASWPSLIYNLRTDVYGRKTLTHQLRSEQAAPPEPRDWYTTLEGCAPIEGAMEVSR